MITIKQFELQMLSEGQDDDVCYCQQCDDYFQKDPKLKCAETKCPECGNKMEDDYDEEVGF